MKTPREIIQEVDRIKSTLEMHSIPVDNVCYKVSGMEQMQLLDYINDLAGNKETTFVIDVDWVKVFGINIVIG